MSVSYGFHSYGTYGLDYGTSYGANYILVEVIRTGESGNRDC